MKVSLETLEAVGVRGFSDSEARAVLAIVRRNRELFLRAWSEYHG